MRIFLYLFFLSLIANATYAQIELFSSSDDNKTIKSIAGGATYLLRQDYYILDTTVKGGKKYGLNKKDYFGRGYYVAIAVKGKFIVDKSINAPWLSDSNFIKLNNKNRYKPELGELAYRRIDEKKYTIADNLDTGRYNTIDLFCKISYKENIQSLPVYEFQDSLLIDTTAWFWLADLKTDLNNEDVILQFESSKGKYSKSKDIFINNKFFYGEKSRSGFIFCAIPEFGVLRYYLCGLILRVNEKFTFVSLKNEMMSSKMSEKKQSTEVINEQIPSLNEIAAKPETTNKNSSTKKKKKRKG